ncbi:MAG: hypothetical protein FWF96_04855, partial [Kiritimatiellaeota bacterium]|nr:hypothetical protein [Kiritimatiellota bacterium]
SADEVMLSASRRTLHAFGNPAASLSGALDYLASYPYGCLEQTTSRAFPLITWVDVLALSPAEKAAVESRVRAGVSRVVSLWRGGGFSPWPRYHQYEARHLLYPLEFFAAARAAGHEVPDGVFNAATESLKQWVREMPAGDASLAYACHVLACVKAPDHGRMMRLRENIAALGIEDRVLLAGAFLEAGNAQACREIMAELPFPGNDLRAAARLLMLYARLSPNSVTGPRLVQRLQRGLRNTGHWGSTSENALMIRALGAWFASQPFPAGDFDLAVSSGQDPVASSGATNLFTLAVGAGNVALANNGGAPAHIAVKTETIPVNGLPAEEDSGLALRRSGGPGDGALARGDTAAYTLTLDTRGATVDDIVLDIPLPAGLEPYDMPVHIRDADTRLDISTIAYQCEKRDDRFLIFLKPARGMVNIRYTVLAVSAGRFVHPPATAAAMYEPDVYSVSGSGEVTVAP